MRRALVAAIATLTLLAALAIAGFLGLVVVGEIPTSGTMYLGAVLTLVAIVAVGMLARMTYTGAGGSS